jgi:hypothetical protein
VEYYRKTFGFKEPVLKTAADLERFRSSGLFGDLWVLAGGGVAIHHPEPKARGSFRIGGLNAEKWLLPISDLGESTPAWFFAPKGGAKGRPSVVIAHPGGKRALMSERPGLVQNLLEKGISVLAVDVRMRGELKRDWRWDEMIWGMYEPMMASKDLLCSYYFLSQHKAVDAKRIFCVGLGDLGVGALLSTTMDHWFAGVAVDDIGLTYTAGREVPDIPSLLRYADLPQIAALAAPRKLWINGAREPFWFTRSAYKLAKAEGKLQITTKHDGDFDYSLAGWVLGQ